MKKITTILPVLLLTVPLGGCFITDKVNEFVKEEIVEGIFEKTTDEDVDIDLNEDGGVEITTEDGETTIGSKAVIPDNWPEDVPIIDYSEIVSASTYKDSTNDTTAYQIMVTSSKNYEDSKEYYSTQMVTEGWEELSVIDVSGTTMFNYEKDNDSSGVWITEEDEEVLVTITVTKEN